MDDYLVGVLSNIGVISFIALSAYLLLLTGEISFGQQAFFAIGAYAAGIATALWGWPLAARARLGRRRRRRSRPCSSACRPCGCTGSISRSRRSPSPKWCASCSSSSAIRSSIDGEPVGPNGADGFRGIRYIFENDVGPLQFLALIYALLARDARRLHAAGALAPRRRLPHDRRGCDAGRAQRHRGRAREGARGRARRRARRARRRALRAPDHLSRAAHLRRDARRAQPRLRA